ncbi:MAG TPA: TRAP transporter fused permease subunit [Vicinamibacterales bacterium]|nr:TRAP transporter fused permease subunit [Vicinamibacterales bacterium]
MTLSRERVASGLALLLSAYALYWVVAIVDPYVYRFTFLLITLTLTFLVGQTAEGPTGLAVANGEGGAVAKGEGGARPMAIDYLWIALSIVALMWPLSDIEAFIYRAATPSATDLALGIAAIIVVLEATRRTTGWILPVTALAFLLYAYAGPLFDNLGLSLIAHRGYSPARIVGTIYMTLEGMFGVPLDVTSTYIILFTIFGAILEHSGAGRFFVDWTMALIGRSGSASGPGRTVTVAGYLLGAVSGSGVANTVMLGTIAWPMMQRAGYPADTAGAILASAGIGAILAPPVMGAAAFLIAEFLRISYLKVIAMAIIPALLYYFSIFLMVEADSRRLNLRPVEIQQTTLGTMTRRGWQHFVSLATIVILMARGFTAFRAVFWATLLAIVFSFFHRDTALRPRRLAAALASGGRGILPIAATTATAGIIVGTITLTGLGIKVAGLIVTVAGGHQLLTIAYAALAVWVLGLAVPVTASYIIAAVTIVPALVQVGVALVAAHMFVFYYAVLSEVSPPTALSPFAGAAVTGGNPLRTTMLSWKYTAPAFIVPFAFTIAPRGLGLLLQAPFADILMSLVTALLGVVGIAVAAGGWLRREATRLERVLAGLSAALLFTPRMATALAGVLLLGLVAALHWRRTTPTPVQRAIDV